MAAITIPKHQTPWQEIQRGMVDQFAEGMVLKPAVKYQRRRPDQRRPARQSLTAGTGFRAPQNDGAVTYRRRLTKAAEAFTGAVSVNALPSDFTAESASETT